MEDKMDSERSYSGDSSSSSESSSSSSDADEDSVEPVRVLGTTLELPQELCENYGIFKEFFSMKTWDSLDDKHKDHLKKFLPKFSENSEEETEKTIKMLFNYEPFHFTSPLNDFYNNLKQGNYRPDIAKMRKFLLRARSKQQKHKVKSYYAKLLPEVLISRERLLAAAKSAPPGPAPGVPNLPPKLSSKNNFKPVYLRAKQRYFEELAAIRNEVGGADTDDENYPEGPPEPSFKKRKQAVGAPISDKVVKNVDSSISGTLGGIDQPQPTSLQCLKNVLAAHRARRQYRENHPELNTTGITLEDIKQRVAIVNGAKKLMFGGQKVSSAVPKLKRGPKKDAKLKISDGKVIKKIKEESENVENKPLLPSIKIKCEQEESDSESSSFIDPVASPRQAKKSVDSIEIKQEVVDKYPNITNSSYDPTLEIKEEPPDVTPVSTNSRIPVHQPVPIKLEDLDGIDMMALPIEIADDSGDVIQVDTSSDVIEDTAMVEVDESLTETTHANFLSLVRALFPARDAHRASKHQLHARCAAVMKSPIAPLNTWYNLSDDWCADLDSALDFLAGERGSHPEDFVPYLQYMPETQVGSEEPVKMYQWIGAGRDCDAILGRLCERWIRASSPQPPSKEPPPPKYPTSWTVRPPTTTDVSEFREQERQRFTAAVKPFTYVQHGYRSVVGPCARTWGTSGGAGSNLLVAERPKHASFASLVRDALARLPNGEGTRHDVLTLLKMSQFLGQCSDQALLNAVSMVLERFSTAKRDPVVKYDQRTAIWTCLHRNRTEEDWLLKSAGRGRTAKGASVLTAPASPPALLPPPLASAARPAVTSGKDAHHTSTSPHGMDLDVSVVEEIIEASDSDVDVDDSSLPDAAPQLSSAQLLMQATQAQGKQPKPKKQSPPQKRPSVPKQTAQTKQTKSLMTQSVKQATLLAQAVKQASLAQSKANIVQAVKNSVPKQTVMIQAPKAITAQECKTITKSTIKAVTKVNIKPPVQSPKQAIAAPKQAVASPKQTVALLKQPVASPKQPLQSPMQPPQSPKPPPPSPKPTPPSPKPPQSPKQPVPSPKSVAAAPSVKTVICQSVTLPVFTQTSVTRSLPSVIASVHKSPLIKQRPLLKSDTSLVAGNKVAPPSIVITQQSATTPPAIHSITSTSILQTQNKVSEPVSSLEQEQVEQVVTQGARSLLIKPHAVHTTVAAATTPTTQAQASRRGVVRVLSPANPSGGKSLISPRALLQDNPATKKRAVASGTISATVAQSMMNNTSVVNSVPSAVTSAVQTRTVQLAGGRTVQLAANQTVHLPGGQAVQLSSGHTLQLSSLQLPTHSVRLPSGQTVQLATPQTMQALKTTKTHTPRPQPAIKTNQPLQVPISSVQLAGQTVQIAGQTVQLAGQSVQLTGHTVKLPSGQSVQVASQNVLPSSVQLPSGQTVQLASGNLQTVQFAGQSVQLQNSGQNVQLGSQTVQIGGQTVQIASGQSVQLPTGQTIQLPSGQTVQLSSGQTLQLASGQTVQLSNQTAKSIPQVVRSQTQVEKTASGQPIVAKLLTNAQGQMVSLEGLGGNTRALMSGVRPRPAVRVLSPATRLTRPLLLTSAKPLHNIILQQSDGTVRVTSSGGASTSQTIVISNIASQTVTSPATTTPVLKLQQVNPIQQVRLAQGIKLHQPVSSAGVATPSGVRSVLMDGQQLKLVGGRHVLARILRPSHPPNQ